jgi:hypothetical protein
LNGLLILVAIATLVVGVLVVGGSALALGAAVVAALHLQQGRPRWYAKQVLRGGLVGAVSGMAVALFVVASAQGGISYGPWIVVLLTVSGFGWTAIGPARRLWPHRLESRAP